MENATEHNLSEQTRMQEITPEACDALHFTMPQPPHVAPLAPQAPKTKPVRRDADQEPQEFQPTPEQVARSMARALRFQEASPDQAIREHQINEGRKMAQAEGFGKKQKTIDERTSQIRAGQSASAQEHNGRAQADGLEAPAPAQANGAPKKKRNRNRHKSHGAQGRSAPAMH